MSTTMAEPVLLMIIIAARNGPAVRQTTVISRLIISAVLPSEFVIEIKRNVKMKPVIKPRNVIVGSASIPVKIICEIITE
jgi:hypothetical protein